MCGVVQWVRYGRFNGVGVGESGVVWRVGGNRRLLSQVALIGEDVRSLPGRTKLYRAMRPRRSYPAGRQPSRTHPRLDLEAVPAHARLVRLYQVLALDLGLVRGKLDDAVVALRLGLGARAAAVKVSGTSSASERREW